MLLLDSSVLLWAIAQSRRIGARTRARIENATAVHVSAVSILELTIKSMLGKIDIPTDLARTVFDQGFVELPVTAAHAAAVGEFPELLRHDPFDRLLVAQAASANLDLLTADRVLQGLGRGFIVDATQ